MHIFFYYSDGKISLKALQYMLIMNLSFAHNTFMYI